MRNLLFICLIVIFSQIVCRNTLVQLLSEEIGISKAIFQSEREKFDLTNYNNGKLTLGSAEKEEILIISDSESFNVNGKLKLITENLHLQMAFTGSQLQYEGVDQWIMISYEDFQGASLGWSKEKYSTCQSDSMFLGGPCNFAGGDTFKTYTDLPPHKSIRITANVHFFDKWEGEQAYLKINDKIAWADSYTWCDKVMQWYCKKYGINACGNDYPDRLSTPLDVISKFKFYFSSTL
jgi:hypothetical protein